MKVYHWGDISKRLGSNIIITQGGEEFICLIKTKDKKVAISMTERIRTEVQKIKIKNMEQSITISIGLVKSNPNTPAIDDIKIADNLLYKAKKQGRNMVCY